MKLLFDANISFKLTKRLSDLFPESSHVAMEKLERAGDQAVWEFAIEQDFVIVSKDEDFHQRSFISGPPPKVIWVRLGNCSTEDIEKAIRRNVAKIQTFHADKESSFLVLGAGS